VKAIDSRPNHFAAALAKGCGERVSQRRLAGRVDPVDPHPRGVWTPERFDAVAQCGDQRAAIHRTNPRAPAGVRAADVG
jgi:hypothetical protein